MRAWCKRVVVNRSEPYVLLRPLKLKRVGLLCGLWLLERQFARTDVAIAAGASTTTPTTSTTPAAAPVSAATTATITITALSTAAATAAPTAATASAAVVAPTPATPLVLFILWHPNG
eukprot:m.212343 g.212343  ORF g.212343 m.212343 type:complete len:118 (-) comp25526_c2_seq1:934-1287(-)